METTLTSFIQQSTNQKKETFSLIKLHGDASERKYYRIHFKQAPSFRSAILMQTPLHSLEQASHFLNIQKYLSSIQVQTPLVYDQSKNLQFILLEDCGDDLLQNAVQDKKHPKVEKLYFLALDEIVKMQHSQSKLKKDCVALNYSFDQDKFVWELQFFLTHTVKGFLKINLNEKEIKVLSLFFNQLASKLASQPKVFTHRDFHSRNLIVQDNQLKVIDFQDARLGPCQYDLVSLVYDSYTPLPDFIVNKLILEFKINQKEKNKNFSEEEFDQVFDWMLFQRSLKAAGTFGFMAEEKKNFNYTRYLPTVLNYALNVLKKYPEFREAKEILSVSTKYELKNFKH